VTILEARTRIGGRSWTVRDGDTLEIMGLPDQIAKFSGDAYFNAGPARLPSWHQKVLGYARKFKVPLEVEVNSSRSAYIIASDGSRIRMRSAINDLRGHLSELLSKAVHQGSLDQSLTAAEKAKLLPFLDFYGDLDKAEKYEGSQRSGFSTLPGAGISNFATNAAQVPLDTLLANESLPMTLFEEHMYMQATMFQPVGGMDQIVKAVERHLRIRPVLGAEVTRIRHDEDGATVGYIDCETGRAHSVKSDYVVCTIPFSVLAKIDADFPKPYAAAIAAVQYDHAIKVAFDAPRFWEQDQIYGGISFTAGETGMIWYPSAGMHSDRGVILGCYTLGGTAAAFAKRSMSEQITMARASIDRTHPGHGVDCIDSLVVDWARVKFSQGPWPAWDPNATGGLKEATFDSPGYRLLNQPDGRLHFAGAQLSQMPGWQEGAIDSAHATVAALAKQVTVHNLTAHPTALAA
jgi:monoamine oxidase